MAVRPPFRADHVGSLLRPAALQSARAAFAAGQIDAAALARAEDAAISEAARRQRDIGLPAVTDGEFRRSWWHLDFLAGFEGLERCALDEGVAFADRPTRAEGIRVSGQIRCSEHPMVAHFAYLRDCTPALAKLTIPAPSALYARPVPLPVDAAVYPERTALMDDLGRAYAQAVREFAAAGCRYLQLDEVFIAMLCDLKYRQQMQARGDDPQTLLGQHVRLINTAVAAAPEDMTVTLHLCRGNYRSTWMGEGSYESVADVLLNEVNVDGFFLEFDDERSGGFEPLRLLPRGRRAALGLVTTKHGDLESRDHLMRRIEAAARFADIDQLCLAPQCGFASTEEGNRLTEKAQWTKLERIVEVADAVWGLER